MLEVSNLTCGYGNMVAVRDFSCSLPAQQILALLGANGAGKSSVLMALMGLVARRSGEIFLKEENIALLPAEERIAKGIALVPEGRRVFPDLSVQENLMVGGHIVAKQILQQGIEQVFAYFPRLAERARQAAGSLSGGEQQMLAIGRALVPKPALLLVDELSLGLMPKVIDECYAVLQALKAAGMAIILVEQNTQQALAVADCVCILEAGNLVWQGQADEAAANKALVDSLLGNESLPSQTFTP